MPQKARRACRRDHLALQIAAPSVPLVEQLEEGEGAVVERGTVDLVGGGEVGHWGGPRVGDKIREGVAGFQTVEFGAGAAGIADKEVDVADFGADGGGDGFEGVLIRDVTLKGDDDAVISSRQFLIQLNRKLRKKGVFTWDISQLLLRGLPFDDRRCRPFRRRSPPEPWPSSIRYQCLRL